MGKYTDDEIRNFKKITCKITADYLGISPIKLVPQKMIDWALLRVSSVYIH
jgi:hypothetical protein